MNSGRKLPRDYVPALGYRAWTGLYDPLVALTTRERAFKRRLLELAAIPEHAQVLDLGCGTGTLALGIAAAAPTAEIWGLDGDPQMLARARAKLGSQRKRIHLRRGDCADLPYAGRSFDLVFSTLLFHHLRTEKKKACAREAFRVLRPGGMLHVADWGKASSWMMRLLFHQVQWIDGYRNTADNVTGRLPGIFREAGFEYVVTLSEMSTMFGTLTLYQASRPYSAA